MKKIVYFLIVLTLVCSVVISSITIAMASEGVKVFRFAYNVSSQHPYHQGALLAAKTINDKTNGKIRIDLYPGAQLGSEPEVFHSVMIGDIDIATGGPGILSEVFKPIVISDMPFIFRDKDHLIKFINSDMAKKMYKDFEKASGTKVLATFYYGTRHVTSNKPIRTPDDLEGVKMRVPPQQIFLDNASAMGANPTPMPYSELYIALQQKVVDSQENPLPTIKEGKFYEVQKYINLTGHMTFAMYVVMNCNTFYSLTEEEQSIFEDAFKESFTNFTSELIYKQEQDLIPFFEDQGVVIIHPDIPAFKKATAKVIEKYKPNWESYGDLIQQVSDL